LDLGLVKFVAASTFIPQDEEAPTEPTTKLMQKTTEQH